MRLIIIKIQIKLKDNLLKLTEKKTFINYVLKYNFHLYNKNCLTLNCFLQYY